MNKYCTVLHEEALVKTSFHFQLIPDKARQSRNPSGDSGTSENDQVDSSGCSTGSESDSSSGSHRVPQSSDSGTGTVKGIFIF